MAIYSWFTHSTRWFSVIMLVYQGVSCKVSHSLQKPGLNQSKTRHAETHEKACVLCRKDKELVTVLRMTSETRLDETTKCHQKLGTREDGTNKSRATRRILAKLRISFLLTYLWKVEWAVQIFLVVAIEWLIMNLMSKEIVHIPESLKANAWNHRPLVDHVPWVFLYGNVISVIVCWSGSW